MTPGDGSRLWSQRGPSKQAPLASRIQETRPLDARLTTAAARRSTQRTLTGRHFLNGDKALPDVVVTSEVPAARFEELTESYVLNATDARSGQ